MFMWKMFQNFNIAFGYLLMMTISLESFLKKASLSTGGKVSLKGFFKKVSLSGGCKVSIRKFL